MDIPEHYSLKNDADDHFEVHDSRDDSSFKISKKELHPAHQVKIMKMAKYAFGTDGADPEDTGEDGVDEGVKLQGTSAPPPEEPQAEEQQQAPLQGIPDLLKMPQEQAPQDPNAVPQGTPQVQAGGNQQSTQDAGGGMYPTTEGLKNDIAQATGAEYKLAAAEQRQNDAVAAQQQKNLAMQQKMFDDQQLQLKSMQDRYDALAKATEAQQIDPEHYWKTKDSRAKMRASIGILLSGLSGANHNMAMDLVQKNIDRDIDAQKANLGKNQSLLSHNLAQQGNMMSAINMTRAQMSAMAEGQLKLIAAQTGNPIIAARAEQAAAKFRMNMIPTWTSVANNQVQMQIRKDVMDRLKARDSGQKGVQDVDLFDLQRAGLVDKATAEKESMAISRRQQAENEAIDAMKSLRQEQKIFGDYGVPNALNPQAEVRLDQAKARLITSIQAAAPSKRLNPEMLSMEIEPFLQKAWSTKTEESALNGILGVIRSHAEPTPIASKYRLNGAINGSNSVPKTFKLGPVK